MSWHGFVGVGKVTTYAYTYNLWVPWVYLSDDFFIHPAVPVKLSSCQGNRRRQYESLVVISKIWRLREGNPKQQVGVVQGGPLPVTGPYKWPKING